MCFSFVPAWTGSNPLAGNQYALDGDDANTTRFGYFVSGSFAAHDGTNTPAVSAAHVTGTRQRYCSRWSTGRNKLRVENVTAGTSSETAFAGFTAIDSSLSIGESLAAGVNPLLGKLDTLVLSGSYDGAR